MNVLLVITNLPDRAAAQKLADTLIEQRFAACVNIRMNFPKASLSQSSVACLGNWTV